MRSHVPRESVSMLAPQTTFLLPPVEFAPRDGGTKNMGSDIDQLIFGYGAVPGTEKAVEDQTIVYDSKRWVS